MYSCVIRCNHIYDHLLKCIQTAGLALSDTCCALEATKKQLHVFRCVRCPNNLARRCWPIYFSPTTVPPGAGPAARPASSEKEGDCATPTVKCAELGKRPESPAGGSVLWFTQHDDDGLDISLVSGLSKRAESTKKNKFGHRCSSFHFTICMCH